MEEKRPRFAARTGWNLEPNRIARLVDERRRSGSEILDLTESNPTRCGFRYEIPGLEAGEYDPDPRGLASTRDAVAAYYKDWNVALSREQILLTSGTSEAYGYLFRLLAEPGDNILVPRPSYPLFDFLAQLHDVALSTYSLDPDHRWAIDFTSLQAACNARSRAVIVVNPNNPTGSLLEPEDRERLVEFCRGRGLALIVDEVFLDYAFHPASSLAGENRTLTFALNGLSKTAALPQMKLAWTVVAGPGAGDALARLEVIADTYLSVSTPVQLAAPELIARRGIIQQQIRRRVDENLRALDQRLSRQSLACRLEVEAGWMVVLRVPRVQTDEEWAIELLDRDGVLLHPGHFFDFPGEGYLVASLIVRPEIFAEGISRFLARVEQRAPS